MKNLKDLIEERSAEKDATEKEATRGCPLWEMLHKMRSVTNRHQCRLQSAQLMTHDVIRAGRSM